MTAQAIYNKVKKHLLTQMAQSENETGSCAYRGTNGLKCAIGCLIPDELYLPEFDSGSGTSVLDLLDDHPKLGPFLIPTDRNDDLHYDTFLNSLQNIHDTNGPSLWAEKLSQFALKYNLQP